MKYLHLYDKQTDYDNKKNTLILPSASLIEENNHVEYNPHQYVEINGIKWATMNVGANDVTDYGLYFQWGDTQGYTAEQVGTGEGKKKFASDWSDYSLTTNGGQSFTKYNETGMTLDLEDDAVHAAWGGSWRMPTTEELDNLKKTVDKEWTDNYNNSGVAGIICKDKNTHEELLFLPACGYAYDGSVSYVGSNGCYWLGSLSAGNVSNAYGLGFNSGDANVGYLNRYLGRCVRGVLAEN